jgi:branched-chain amino acid transport system ATP-binding protein
MLRVDGLCTGYGSQQVLRDVGFDVPRGGLTTLLGPNGAGKSTALMALNGTLPVWRGTIELEGRSLAGLGPRARARRGLVLVPEGRRIFGSATVEENLRLGAWAVGRNAKATRASLAEVFERFPRLSERRDQRAGTLSGGEQQMLAIGRGLMANPKLLMVDECSLGLSPVMVIEVLRILATLAQAGLTVLAVEQNTSVLRFASSAILLEQGSVARTASGDSLANFSQSLRQSYLGGDRG